MIATQPQADPSSRIAATTLRYDLRAYAPIYPTTNQLGVLTLDREKFIVKQYRGPQASERRDCEEATLRLWSANGFQVPEPVNLRLPTLAEPYLVRRYVAGHSLREHLRDPKLAAADKLTEVFVSAVSVAERHRLVLETGDLRFIHPDANTGNIVTCDAGAVWIDFETAIAGTDAVDAAAVELSRFLLCVAQDLSAEQLPELVELIRAVFQQQDATLDRLWRRTLHRPLQTIHRWRDRRRKAGDPGRITKYDVAEALRDSMRRAPHRRKHDRSSD